MSRINDVGGVEGFPGVVEEADEPAFHADWEAHVFALNGALLKRRDFKYDHLLDHATHAGPGTLFHSDAGEPTYLPTPCGERPACHYLKVADV